MNRFYGDRPQVQNAGIAGRQQVQNAVIPGRLPDQNAGIAGIQQAQNAGIAGRQQLQNAGIAGRPRDQNAGIAGRQPPQNAGIAGRQQLQNAGIAGRHQAQNAGIAGRQQLQNAGIAGRPRDQNAGIAGRQQPQNAGIAGRQQLQNAGIAGRHQAQNAGIAGRQLGRNAANGGRQQGRNAGPGRQQGQNVGAGGQQGQNARNAWRQRHTNEGNAERPQGQNNGRQRGQNEGYRGRQQNQNTGFYGPHNDRRPLGHNETAPHTTQDYQRNSESNSVQQRHVISFQNLEMISKADVSEVFQKLADKQKSFTNLLQSLISKPDIFPLLMQITFKVTQSPYEQMKQKYILEFCNSAFILSFQNYLINLPYCSNKSQNNLYWKDQDGFWKCFVGFCDCIVTLSPSTALKHCRSLIDSTSRACLDGLKSRHEYSSSDDYNNQLQAIRDQLSVSEQEVELETKRKPGFVVEVNEPPPECFRQLNVIPERDDLLLEFKPYLRPNRVHGAYDDVHHYLDVQFRLLREDCFEPLRKGIRDYLENPKKKKYENVRIFHGVQFIKPYVNKDKIGSVIQFGEKETKRFNKMKWAHNKRFIFGSLMLLTKDNFKSVITVTILDKDPQLLTNGQIPVTVFSKVLRNADLYNDDVYTMVESSVYFEPYLHVMRALQDPNLPRNLPMQKYLVQLDMRAQPPAYLNEESEYVVGDERFLVLGEQWPSAESLGMNESQQRAFRLALTHECAVIQGPPGTGKTFLGVQLARTLLHNNDTPGPLILLICFTNHALDQFLKAIMQITPNVARIGGQSRDKDLESVNLSALRKGQNSRLFWNNKHELQSAVMNLNALQNEIDSINDGVISVRSLQHLPEAQVVAKQYKGKKDPIEFWLFENATEFVNVEAVNDMINDVDAVVNDDMQTENHFGREHIDLDDFEYDNEDQNNKEINLSFSAHKTSEKCQSLRSLLNHTVDTTQREQIEELIYCLMCKIKLLQDMKLNQSRRRYGNITDQTQVFQIPMHQRWAIYLEWERVLMQKFENKIKQLQEVVLNTQGAYEEARMAADAEVLRTRRVIGVTTSGAARIKKLLMTLKTPIVIVEEAAEVLEQHIISSLTPDCQHLILIGDHQQLRPSAASQLLARHYQLEVSLFERMVTNRLHSCRLSVQHRMRPSLAQLISPHIYRDLQNHPSVENFPDVRGLANNLFFFTHDYKETPVEDSSTRSNQQEADLVLSLANYIMQQDYQPEDVTILAAYAGQLFYMKKQQPRYRFLSKVKITVVDNYQGEESKIILLSLVRNNNDGKIGFLGTANRICVAVSRAREGFYMFGNINILKRKSELWTDIAGTLEKNQSLGSSLILRCENHFNQLTQVSTVEDFNKCPEGGCLLKCNFSLPCNHPCGLVCHGYDRNHINVTCKADCSRLLCQYNHNCPLKCAVPCRPCMVPMDKTFEKCGHVNKVKCHKLEDPSVKCKTVVTKDLPCKHQAKAPCFEKPEDVECPVKCNARLKCGHACRNLCHAFKDPRHEMYLCEATCARNKRGCSLAEGQEANPHRCNKRCHEPCDPCTVEVTKKRSECTHKEKVQCNVDVNEKNCMKNCARSLPCGHHCRKKCCEPCGDCKQQVTKIIPECGHDVKVSCDKTVTRKDCTSKCNRTLPCGHPCHDFCSQECDSTKCEELLTTRSFDSPCGHKVHLPCNKYRLVRNDESALRAAVLRACAAACGAELSCGHTCGGTCGACAQQRLHRACSRPCNHYNICGHLCKEPCKEICPPCSQPCEVRCPHSRCSNICGEPCEPCNEACSRACAHAACTRRCGAACSSAACTRRCPQQLKCGHACRGLCGEPCPPVCRDCSPDTFPVDFLGDPFDDDDKFVLLDDCGHVMELENMDNLMRGDRDDIKIRDCPYCRKPIINTYRYKEIVNDMFRTKINPIKQKIYGTKKAIREKIDELKTKFQQFDTNYRSTCLSSRKKITSVYNQLFKTMKNCRNMHLMQLNMIIVSLNILEIIMECYKNYDNLPTRDIQLKTAFMEIVDMICDVVNDNKNKLSFQMQNDINNEIKRLNAITQLNEIFNKPEYKSNIKEVAAEAKGAVDSVLDWQRFDEARSFKALDVLQKKVKVSGIVTKQERLLIVQAIGLKPGHWFQCPNGHLYCIGECGGAMQQSTCPECGAAIGGSRHQLLSTNTHATIDGSSFPAWSEMANMANFRL